jgi:hypothetical protein
MFRRMGFAKFIEEFLQHRPSCVRELTPVKTDACITVIAGKSISVLLSADFLQETSEMVPLK